MKISLKLSAAVLTAVFLTACSNKMYLPEAHMYANGIKNELVKAGICNNSTCANFIQLKGFGWRVKNWQSGSVSLKVLNVNSQQLAQSIVSNCSAVKAKMPPNLPVTLELYSGNTVENTQPVLVSNCI